MAEPLRNPYESEPIAPLPTALPETPPEELNQGPYVAGREETPSATERVGNAVGDAIGTLRSRVRSGLRVVAGKSREAGETIGDATDSAQDKIRELSEDAEVRFGELRDGVYQQLRKGRREIRRAFHERPLQSIAVIGGAGIVIGFLLRIWRANAD